MNNKEKQYVPNDVYRFRITSMIEIPEITVYVDEGAFDKDEDKVLEAYFTPEKKKEIIEKYVEELFNKPNALKIYCCDLDGGYNITEDKIFRK